MEENLKEECSSSSKQCCMKWVAIVVACSLICFFIGYYAGSRSLARVSRAAINRPFSPRNIVKMPSIPPKIPNVPKIQNTRLQRPPIPNTPNVQRPPVSPRTQMPRVNTPNAAKGTVPAKANNKTAQKK